MTDDPGLVELRASDAASAASAIGRLLDRRPDATAAFALDNVSCPGAVRELTRRPERVAVTTFCAPEGADLFSIPVIGVDYDAAALGRTAARWLLERIDGDRIPPRHLVVPVRMAPAVDTGSNR